jgi:hypothetical protein
MSAAQTGRTHDCTRPRSSRRHRVEARRQPLQIRRCLSWVKVKNPAYSIDQTTAPATTSIVTASALASISCLPAANVPPLEWSERRCGQAVDSLGKQNCLIAEF